jgi:hypothetical protein
MNKYLEKIAKAYSGEKVEIEPGVYYHLDKHELKPTTAHMAEYMDKRDTRSRLGVGAVYGAVGGFMGAAMGDGYHGTRLRQEAPLTTTNYSKFGIADLEWENTRPVPDFNTNSRDPIGDYNRKLRDWRDRQPQWHDFTETRPSEFKPRLTNLVNKYGHTPTKRITTGLGGVAGALVMGGLGYAVGGLLPEERPIIKNQYLEKLENRHEHHINELEGWND